MRLARNRIHVAHGQVMWSDCFVLVVLGCVSVSGGLKYIGGYMRRVL
jgi:hypothetical protein